MAREIHGQSNSRTAYEEKISSLQADLEKAARDLSRAEGERDAAQNGRDAAQKLFDTLQARIAGSERKIGELDSTIKRKEDQITRLTESAAEVKRTEDENINEKQRISHRLTEEIKDARKTISHLPDAKGELARMEKARITAERDAGKAELRLEDAEKKIAKLHEKLDAREKKLALREGAVGAKATAIERLRGKLEGYVKRLQRYYDQHGIKLNILSEFDIKNHG